jgi:hypothetical protein
VFEVLIRTGLLSVVALVLGSVSVSQAAAPAVLPPTLVALEQKMGELRVNSERFSQTTRGTDTLTTARVTRKTGGGSGKRTPHTRHISLNQTQLGEVSVSPAEGELFSGEKSKPMLIWIGSTLYLYQGGGSRSHPHRPWLRIDGGDLGAGLSYPFHGGGPLETGLGGTGSYAGLVNLLGTAVGSVTTAGPISVRGQQTSEFTLTVEPLKLLKGLSARELKALARHSFAERLDLFMTEAGLPIKIVLTTASGKQTLSETTEVLAVNVPVTIKPPPADKTISEAQLRHLRHKEPIVSVRSRSSGKSKQ